MLFFSILDNVTKNNKAIEELKEKIEQVTELTKNISDNLKLISHKQQIVDIKIQENGENVDQLKVILQNYGKLTNQVSKINDDISEELKSTNSFIKQTKDKVINDNNKSEIKDKISIEEIEATFNKQKNYLNSYLSRRKYGDTLEIPNTPTPLNNN